MFINSDNALIKAWFLWIVFNWIRFDSMKINRWQNNLLAE